MRFDEFTFSLPRLWIAVCVLLLIDFICLSSLGFGNPVALNLIRWLPRPLAGVMSVFGPFAVTAIWLVIVVLGAAFHGRRAFWLLLPAVIFLPVTCLQLIVWACTVHGSCP
jgi:hypothetical protein